MRAIICTQTAIDDTISKDHLLNAGIFQRGSIRRANRQLCLKKRHWPDRLRFSLQRAAQMR